MSELETSSLLQHERANNTFPIPSSTRPEICSKWRQPWAVAWVVLAILCLLGMKSKNSQSFSIDHEKKRIDVDTFIHSFESANSNQMFLEAPNFEYNEGYLDHLVYFNFSSSYDLLKTDGKASSATDFYSYVQGGWEAQINQAYCGIASSAALMNSLKGKIDLPQDPTYIPFLWATQNQIIRNDCVKENVYDAEKSNRLFFGLGLDMATEVLNCNLSGQGYVVEAHHVNPNEVTVDEVRDMIQDAILEENSRIMINYDRGSIGQGPLGHGHFSPIGSYNAELDAFLVMDVAKYKFPPVWVPTLNLYHGIASLDSCSNFDYPDHVIDIHSLAREDLREILKCEAKYRGFVIVRPE